MSIGSEILAERKRNRLRQDDVAKRIGIAAATLVDIEYDRIEITETQQTEILRAIVEVAAERTAA